MLPTVLTWGQIKRLCQEAENLLEEQEKPVTAPNLVAATFSLITIAVCSLPCTYASNYTYWAYS